MLDVSKVNHQHLASGLWPLIYSKKAGDPRNRLLLASTCLTCLKGGQARVGSIFPCPAFGNIFFEENRKSLGLISADGRQSERGLKKPDIFERFWIFSSSRECRAVAATPPS